MCKDNRSLLVNIGGGVVGGTLTRMSSAKQKRSIHNHSQVPTLELPPEAGLVTNDGRHDEDNSSFYPMAAMDSYYAEDEGDDRYDQLVEAIETHGRRKRRGNQEVIALELPE